VVGSIELIEWFRRREVARRLAGHPSGIGGGTLRLGRGARIVYRGLAEEIARANDGQSSLSSNATRVAAVTPYFSGAAAQEDETKRTAPPETP
jgi:hypothetical protein